LLALGLVGCAASSTTEAGAGDRIRVVAAEGFWGSIAGQLGGDKVTVTSIITNPDADPHDFEPRAQDGRAFASARYVIVNGVGYDPWMSKLLAADGKSGPDALVVGDLVGVKEGGNPHRWYSPPDVSKVIDRISADYKRLDPTNAAFYDERRATFVGTGLERYTRLVADIGRRFGGTPIGASESVFSPMADALGLRVLTPASFLGAISEGAEPAGQDKAAVDAQIKGRQVKVYVYNGQNSTPDVKAQLDLARAVGIPVVAVTETPPPSATFQDWQADQLERLAQALAAATGA